jgi:hypothetical protein
VNDGELCDWSHSSDNPNSNDLDGMTFCYHCCTPGNVCGACSSVNCNNCTAQGKCCTAKNGCGPCEPSTPAPPANCDSIVLPGSCQQQAALLPSLFTLCGLRSTLWAEV